MFVVVWDNGDVVSESLCSICLCFRHVQCALLLGSVFTINYGIHILRANKFHPCLNDLKNAVFLCKDRQEDFLAWLTVNSVVQNALKVVKTYHIVRVPEPLIQYHDNCKTQKRFLHPESVSCNKNGDAFVLDSATPCIHAIDRSAVSKVVTVGCYGLSQYSHMEKQTGKDLRLSNSIRSMVVSKDDVLYIADPLRGEIIILSNAAKARALAKSPLYTITIENCSSGFGFDYGGF